MKFKYLGTAAAEGLPGMFCACPTCRLARRLGGKNIRLRSGALIDDTLLIDISPDINAESLLGYLDLTGIRSIIITHGHSDHCNMYDMLYRSDPCFCLPENEYTLNIYGNDECQRRFETANKEFVMVHTSFTRLHAFEGFEAEGCTVTPLPACHAFEQEAFIFLIEKQGKRILYANDTGWLPEKAMEYLRGRRCDMISFDCTMALSVPDADYGHMGINTVDHLRRALIAQGTADENTVCICHHFSHNGLNGGGKTACSFEELETEIAKYGLLTAYDKMELEI